LTRKILGIVLALSLASCLPTSDGLPEDLSGQQVHLTILHTSDIHSRLIPYEFSPLKSDQDLGLIPEAGPFGGATRLAALLKRERANSERVIHLDSGDSFQGAPIFNVNRGEAEYRFDSLVHLDAAALGNHEFDAGLTNFVQKARDFASFPVLGCNYAFDDPKNPGNQPTDEVIRPYTIFNAKGIRVGVIGMGNLSTMTGIQDGGNSLQLTPIEQNEAARAYVDFLKPMVDLVVVVSHLGLNEDQNLIQGYQAYFQYGKIKPFLTRAEAPWTIAQWFGPEGRDESVVAVNIPGVSGIDVVFGGHLHIVLNPPQELKDPSGRKVILSHSGAFAKYLGRLDLVVQMPPKGGAPEGAEVSSFHYRVFPIDALWCSEAMHEYYKANFWNPGEFGRRPEVIAAEQQCQDQEDRATTQLLQPYILNMDFGLNLPSVFGYAPQDIARRNNSTGGDSPLGNLLADAMRTRKTVESQVALTNSLGIRDSLYTGTLTQENMFNVFPFENTINLMYLGGGEMQELFDFVTDRSADRGCVSQAQISGARFVMDCAQSQLNSLQIVCDASKVGADNGTDCPQDNRDGRNPWQCLPDQFGIGHCWAHSAEQITIGGEPLNPDTTYRIAVNDYIAHGGSGFNVLKRNTTTEETGISLRDTIVGYMQGFCSCADINAGHTVSAAGEPCGHLVNGAYVVDDGTKGFCQQAAQYEDQLGTPVGSCTCTEILERKTDVCGPISDQQFAACSVLPGPNLGPCTCTEALDPTSTACGYVTQEQKNFCQRPTGLSIAVGYEDGRIGRRVQ
jgi:5'-nucleotidase/UDP-sugar diphosphatase